MSTLGLGGPGRKAARSAGPTGKRLCPLNPQRRGRGWLPTPRLSTGHLLLFPLKDNGQPCSREESAQEGPSLRLASLPPQLHPHPRGGRASPAVEWGPRASSVGTSRSAEVVRKPRHPGRQRWELAPSTHEPRAELRGLESGSWPCPLTCPQVRRQSRPGPPPTLPRQ